MKTRYLNNLKHLQGLECWSIVGGKGTGSMISLKFGKKLPRKANSIEIEKLKISPFESEYSILTYDCWWRIDSENEVLFGVDEFLDNQEEYINKIQQYLCDSFVDSIQIWEPGYDLSIKFSNGYFLRIFCWDIQPDEDGDPVPHYDFFSPDGIFSVVGKGEIEYESRNIDES